eukprot:sb/3461283/
MNNSRPRGGQNLSGGARRQNTVDQTMLLRVALLILCVILLFVCIRFCEWLTWLESERLPLHLVDPISLSIKELQRLLDARGIPHDELVEKSELIDAVENSGGLTTEESEVLLHSPAFEESLNFTSERHFLEEVEDSKSTVWAVRVVPHGHKPFPNYPLWNVVSRRLSRIGIQTGTFYCPRHNSWCLRQGWKIVPALIIAMPSGDEKGSPRIEVYQGQSTERSILKWFYIRLEGSVDKLKSERSYHTWEEEPTTPVKVLHHTDGGCRIQHLVPAFFSALAVQFIGKVMGVLAHLDCVSGGLEHNTFSRVSFAVMDTSQPCHLKNRPSKTTGTATPTTSVPARSLILIKTPEFTHVYGSRKGEQLQHRALKLFMTTLTPTSNDLFVLALMLINYTCLFEVFLSSGNFARRIFRTLWFMAKGNFLLCSIWLPLVSLSQISQLRPLLSAFLSYYRLAMNTELAAVIRHDVLVLARCPLLVGVTLLLSVLTVTVIDRKFKLGLITNDDIQLPFLDFMPTVEHLVHFDPITWPLYTTRVSEVPDEKWLQRCVAELMTSIPTWEHGTCWGSCEDGEGCRGCFPTGSQPSPECAICLDQFRVGVSVCNLPCTHTFHQSCTEAWMSSECENSIKELQRLLDARGIPHDELVEKSELIDAVENSGGLTTEESEVLLHSPAFEESLNFTSERHFLEEVEDSKSTVWAVRVVPHGHKPFPNYPLWNVVSRRLSRIGIQTGTFYCPRHNSWCLRQGWKIVPALIIAMPSGDEKGSPRIEVYQGQSTERSILKWFYNRLEGSVDKLKSERSYHTWEEEPTTPVKVLHHTDGGCRIQHLVPAFFSALAVQFIGKVSFAVMDTSQPCHLKNRPSKTTGTATPTNSVPARSLILIKTPEFTHVYGSRKGEQLQHRALKLFMTTLTPTSNDLFVLALMLINYTCLFEVFLSSGNFARRIFRTLWFMAKGNFLLCSIWLPLVSLSQISQLRPLLSAFLSYYRLAMNTELAAVIRHDVLVLARCPLLVGVTLLLSVLTVTVIDRKFKLGLITNDDIQLPFLDFMPTVEHLVHFDPITWPLYTTRVSEVPDEKWLQRCVAELMTSIPTWEHGTCWGSCEDGEGCRGCFPTGSQPSPECAICLDQFRVGVSVCNMPCTHTFHQSCTEAWMSSECENRWKCPMCREAIF